MALVDAFTGLRVSELLALKWSEIDFDKKQINITRGIVYGVVGKCKSKASAKPVPLDSVLADALRNWQLATPFNNDDDWVFCKPET